MDGSRPDSRPAAGRAWRRLGPVAGLGVFYLIVTSASFVGARSIGEQDWPLRADQVGYYIYLPAILTDEGLSFEGMGGPRWERMMDRGFAGFYGRGEETGRLVNGFTPGVAVLQAPLFLTAHVVAAASGAETDGFSAPYRLVAALGGSLYATLGLLFVFLALCLHFPRRVAGSVVLLLGLGTNLLYYATLEPVMTHAYSFFTFSLLLWATLAWERSPSVGRAVLAGAALGLTVIIRPTNGVVALVPAAYLGARHLWDGVPADRGRLLRHLLIAAGMAGIFSLPLFSYWKYATGEWITNPFGGGGTFYLDEPNFTGVLWSYRKGWFVYTPLMLSAIPGLFLLRRYVPRMTVPLVACAVAIIYIAASYWAWWFGGSFGLRAFVELSSPLSLALAAFVAWGSEETRRRRIINTVFAVLIGLNLFQTYQYVRGYIHWDGMTRETYWAVFLRPTIPPDEFEDIRQGWDLELPRLPVSMQP